MIPRFANLDDAPRVVEICTHPEVRRWTAHDGAPTFDVRPWLLSRNMIVLVEKGCFLSNWLGDATYGVHTNILPEGRGKAALLSGGLALMLAFLRSRAETFMTPVPRNNKAAAWFTNAMHFRYAYTLPLAWVQGGQRWDVDHFRLDIDDWILQGHLEAVGKVFHAELESLGHASHPENRVHDCYVGATCAMINAGNAVKAIRVYNRWARGAGFVPLDLICQNPLCIDARDFLIHVEGPEKKLRIELKEKDHA